VKVLTTVKAIVRFVELETFPARGDSDIHLALLTNARLLSGSMIFSGHDIEAVPRVDSSKIRVGIDRILGKKHRPTESVNLNASASVSSYRASLSSLFAVASPIPTKSPSSSPLTTQKANETGQASFNLTEVHGFPKQSSFRHRLPSARESTAPILEADGILNLKPCRVGPMQG